jgi:hypothetical protein
MAHFKLETDIRGLMCAFTEGEELAFRYKAPLPIVVSLKERVGWEKDFRRGNAICTAVTVRDIEPDIQTGISDNIIGNSINWKSLNENSVKFIDNIYDSLRTISRATVTMFNWTHGRDSPLDPFGSIQAWYSESGEQWHKYSIARSIGLDLSSATTSIIAKYVRVDEVVQKVEAGAEEPLGRQLFREASSLASTNPRSALVIGVTAAEVGLKRLIGTLIPEANWLVQEIQMPPATKIMRDFVRTLPVKAKLKDGRPLALPSKLINQVEKAFQLRNKVVHVGVTPPSREELARMLQAISDLLWICDVYLGEHWAMRHVSLETQKEWQPKTN